MSFRPIHLLAALLVAGCGCDDRAMRNGEMQAAVNTARLAIEQYASDHKGSYPPTEQWMAVIKQRDYLPDHELPRNPWTRKPQLAFVRLPPGLPGAKSLATGAKKVEAWAPLGKGREPDKQKGAVDALDFGALIYDRDPRTNTFVLYGVGKRGDQAIVAGYGDSFGR